MIHGTWLLWEAVCYDDVTTRASSEEVALPCVVGHGPYVMGHVSSYHVTCYICSLFVRFIKKFFVRFIDITTVTATVTDLVWFA